MAKQKEVTMATGKNIGFTEYCDSVHWELTDMKSRLQNLIGKIGTMPPQEREVVKSHKPHLEDIIRTIDWKIEILEKVCPYSWTGFGADVESTVSVEASEAEYAAPGFIGG